MGIDNQQFHDSERKLKMTIQFPIHAIFHSPSATAPHTWRDGGLLVFSKIIIINKLIQIRCWQEEVRQLLLQWRGRKSGALIVVLNLWSFYCCMASDLWLFQSRSLIFAEHVPDRRGLRHRLSDLLQSVLQRQTDYDRIGAKGEIVTFLTHRKEIITFFRCSLNTSELFQVCSSSDKCPSTHYCHFGSDESDQFCCPKSVYNYYLN